MNNVEQAIPGGASRDAAAPPQGHRPRNLSLRVQGYLLILLGLVLVIAYALFLASQKNVLRQTYTTLDTKQILEGRLYRLSAALGRIDRDFDNATALSDPPPSRFQHIERHTRAVVDESADLIAGYPGLGAECEKLVRGFGALEDHSSASEMHAVMLQLHHTLDVIDQQITSTSSSRKQLSDDYYRVIMSIAATSAVVSLLALIGFGAFTIFFFSRLTIDVGKLSASARDIAQGRHFHPLEINRHDEVGELMESMNWMAAQLVEREKQLVIARQQYFHEEKMIAVSSLAAGVAHEVGNPLETISMVAQAVADAKEKNCKSRGQNCHPEMILDQIRRISGITRDLANIVGPSQPELELHGLNELIRNTCRFMRYDKRYRNIELSVALDPQLPALRIVGDQFVQVFMNLLINAADSFGPDPQLPPRVEISTQLADGAVVVKVADNGVGMSAAVLDQAFEPFFTTKPAGQGSGLGLAVCKSIIAAYGGTLTLESEQGVGTTARIALPTETAAPSGAPQNASLRIAS